MTSKSKDETGVEIIGRYADLVAEANTEPYVLTEDVVIPVPTRKQMRELNAARSEDDADKALFGASYKDVIALFDDQPFQAWNKFVVDFKNHMFGKGADDVEGKSPA